MKPMFTVTVYRGQRPVHCCINIDNNTWHSSLHHYLYHWDLLREHIYNSITVSVSLLVCEETPICVVVPIWAWISEFLDWAWIKRGFLDWAGIWDFWIEQEFEISGLSRNLRFLDWAGIWDFWIEQEFQISGLSRNFRFLDWAGIITLKVWWTNYK